MKHIINSEADILELLAGEVPIEAGDVIVHKGLEYYTLIALLAKNLGASIAVVPADVGTEVYAIKGFNTSVVKVGYTPEP